MISWVTEVIFMKSGQSILTTISGFGFLIVSTLQYLRDPSSYNVPLIFFFIVFVIIGIFELRGYYNKIGYILSCFFLVVMWIVSLIKPLSSDVNSVFYYIEVGIITLAIIILFIDSLKRFRKKEKTLDCYNKALTINSEDIGALNNKGVELSRQKRYDDAIKCFDKVLEIDSEDTIAFNNKNVLEKKLKHRTLADYLEDTPQLGINEKEGRLILEIKKE